MWNHKSIDAHVPSVEGIVSSTDDQQTLVYRLQGRTRLLWWRAIWGISFVIFWVLIILTYTKVISADWYFLIAAGVFIAAISKWHYSSLFCEDLNSLTRAIEATSSNTPTDKPSQSVVVVKTDDEATDESTP
jgi:hypothetical protein